MANSTLQARRSAEKLAAHLYEYEAPYGDSVCVYCGDTATTMDHAPSLAYAASLVEILSEADRRKRKFRLYPACRDCNCRLHDCVYTGIAERRAEVRRRLRRKHARLLGEWDWSDGELNRLGYCLRSYITAAERKRRWLVARLKFPEWR